jgi:CheY-specific phosphatase CheX
MEQLNVNCREFINHVVDVSMNFLAEETQLESKKLVSAIKDLQKLQLRYMTSIMSVEGNLKMLLAFSFDKNLIEEVFRRYAQDIEIDESEIGLYIEETAGEIINIVLGNAISKLNIKNHVISLSPPVVILEAKSITRIKESEFFTYILTTDFGVMEIFCVCPKELSELINDLEEV